MSNYAVPNVPMVIHTRHYYMHKSIPNQPLAPTTTVTFAFACTADVSTVVLHSLRSSVVAAVVEIV